MEKQKYVLSYNDMGIHSLISQIRSPRTLDNYINDKLGKLIEADKVQDSELCNTLRLILKIIVIPMLRLNFCLFTVIQCDTVLIR